MTDFTARLRDLERGDWIGVALFCFGLVLTGTCILLVAIGGLPAAFGGLFVGLVGASTVLVGFGLRRIWARTRRTP